MVPTIVPPIAPSWCPNTCSTCARTFERVILGAICVSNRAWPHTQVCTSLPQSRLIPRGEKLFASSSSGLARHLAGRPTESNDMCVCRKRSRSHRPITRCTSARALSQAILSLARSAPGARDRAATAVSVGSHTSTSVSSAAAFELCVGWR
jgi:hypothetical protein